jgi:hypothetical protein
MVCAVTVSQLYLQAERSARPVIVVRCNCGLPTQKTSFVQSQCCAVTAGAGRPRATCLRGRGRRSVGGISSELSSPCPQAALLRPLPRRTPTQGLLTPAPLVVGVLFSWHRGKPLPLLPPSTQGYERYPLPLSPLQTGKRGGWYPLPLVHLSTPEPVVDPGRADDGRTTGERGTGSNRGHCLRALGASVRARVNKSCMHARRGTCVRRGARMRLLRALARASTPVVVRVGIPLSEFLSYLCLVVFTTEPVVHPCQRRPSARPGRTTTSSSVQTQGAASV